MNDFKFALRSLGKQRGFSFVVIATLALGLGAAITIFTVVNAVLLRPLPYPQPKRVVELRELATDGHGMAFAEPNFEDLRARTRSFEAIARYNSSVEAIAGGNEPARVHASAVSQDFFRVLGVKAERGRLFAATENSADKQAVVVSHGFWQRALGGRADLENITLRFSDRAFSIAGVLPAEVEFPPATDVWYAAEIFPPNPSRTAHNWRVAARLRADVSAEAARAEIGALGQQLQRDFGVQTDAASFGLAPLRERLIKNVRGALWLLCGAVGLLLVISCSNVANLLLVRLSSRRKEIALRTALGASRWRLARQFLCESLLLTLSAGGLGILLAQWAVHLVLALNEENLPHLGRINLDARVLIFSVALSLAVGLGLGLVPLWQASQRRLQADLVNRGASGGQVGTQTRNLLVVAQVALTLMLLVGAGLLGRSFQALLKVDPGFQSESAVAMTLSLADPEDAAARERLAQFHHSLLERLQALPGMISLGGTSALPMSGNGGNGTFIMEDGGKSAQTMEELARESSALVGSGKLGDAEFRVASAGYFKAMGIPLLRGRVFQESDGPNAPHAALVSQALARRYWPRADAIGQQLQFGGMDGDLHLLTVVGVVGDVRDDGLEAEVRPTVYVNYRQRPRAAAQFSIVLRGQGDAANWIAAVRRETRALNPEVPMEFQTLAQVISESLGQRRFTMMILGGFAAAALLLAMIGLYGLMSYLTAERTSEIGIRMALGAQRGEVLRMILRQGLLLSGAGVLVGILGASAGMRLLRSLLYGVTTSDLGTYAGVILLLGAAVLLASFWPARRAMQVDPMVALRHE